MAQVAWLFRIPHSSDERGGLPLDRSAGIQVRGRHLRSSMATGLTAAEVRDLIIECTSGAITFLGNAMEKELQPLRTLQSQLDDMKLAQQEQIAQLTLLVECPNAEKSVESERESKRTETSVVLDVAAPACTVDARMPTLSKRRRQRRKMCSLNFIRSKELLLQAREGATHNALSSHIHRCLFQA